VQAEEVGEASENEKEMVEPEPQRQPEPIKRKQPQVRPWDIGKEGELLVAVYSVNLFGQGTYLAAHPLFTLICNILLCLRVLMRYMFASVVVTVYLSIPVVRYVCDTGSQGEGFLVFWREVAHLSTRCSAPARIHSFVSHLRRPELFVLSFIFSYSHAFILLYLLVFCYLCLEICSLVYVVVNIVIHSLIDIFTE